MATPSVWRYANASGGIGLLVIDELVNPPSPRVNLPEGAPAGHSAAKISSYGEPGEPTCQKTPYRGGQMRKWKVFGEWVHRVHQALLLERVPTSLWRRLKGCPMGQKAGSPAARLLVKT